MNTIKMIAAFDLEGRPTPKRFGTRDGKIYNVDGVLTRSNRKIAGEPQVILQCACTDETGKQMRKMVRYYSRQMIWVLSD